MCCCVRALDNWPNTGQSESEPAQLVTTYLAEKRVFVCIRVPIRAQAQSAHLYAHLLKSIAPRYLPRVARFVSAMRATVNLILKTFDRSPSPRRRIANNSAIATI